MRQPLRYMQAGAVRKHTMLERALRRKKESQGYGQLIPYPDGSLWKVEAVEYDYSECDADGHATRGLPSEHGVRYPVRPPYYVRANVAELELPPH